MRNLLVIFVIFGLFLTGCEEYLDERFVGDSARDLVVEGGITTDTMAHKISLSWSGDFFDKGPKEMVTDADVSISDGQNSVILGETEPGIYSTSAGYHGIIGNTYTLSIRLPDGSSYSSSEKINPLPEIDSIRFEKTSGFDAESGELTEGYNLLYYGPEPEGIGDHYLWSVLMDGVLYTDTLYENVFTSDEFVDGNYIKDLELFFIPDDRLPEKPVTITLEMFSISKEYYDYITGIMLETVWKGSPWDGPPANAVGNISNGALGFFTASDKKTISKVLQKE